MKINFSNWSNFEPVIKDFVLRCNSQKKRRETGSWNTEGNREPKSEGNRELEYGGKPGGEKDKLSASPWRASQGRQEFSKMGLFLTSFRLVP